MHFVIINATDCFGLDNFINEMGHKGQNDISCTQSQHSICMTAYV